MAKPEPTITVGGYVVKSCPLTPMTNAEMLAQLSVVSGQTITPDQQEPSIRMRCDQCQALMINGVFCHETGCPNSRSRYDVDSGEWIKQRKCFDCGCTVDADDPCCNADNDDEYNSQGDDDDDEN